MKLLMTGMEWFPGGHGGGLDRYFYDESHALAMSGSAVAALVTSLEAEQILPPLPITLRAMAVPGASLLQRWQGARREVRQVLQEGVDVINAHFALYAYPWLRDLPPQVPLVVNFQGPWADEIAVESSGVKTQVRSACARQIERKVYLRANRVITLSTAFRDLIHERYGVPLERIRVIPGGLDITPYLAAASRREARTLLQWPHERRILVAVRRLARRMGLEELIRAMQEVRSVYPDVLLLLAGKGPLAAELQARIGHYGLEDHVRLLGFVPDADLPLAYAAADFSVVPTVALEGFGLITVESLASGTPVLGTSVGGTSEILQGLQPSLLFEQPTHDAIAHLIKAALANQIALPDRDECRAYAQQFSWPVVLPKIYAVFEEALNECRTNSKSIS